MKHSLIIILYIASIIAGQAQPRTLRLTLADAIHMAQDSAITAREARASLEAARHDYDAYIASRLWQLKLSSQPSFEMTSMPSDPNTSTAVGGTSTTFSLGAALTAEQLIAPTGGVLYAQMDAAWSEFLGRNADAYRERYGYPRMFSISPLRIGYRQSLLGYNASRWEKRIEQQMLDAAERTYRSTLATVAEQAADYFFDYVSYSAYVDMYEVNALTADSLYKIGKEKFAIASIRKDELISLELSLLNIRNTLADMQRRKRQARLSLLSYLRIPDDDSVTLDVVLPDEPPTLLINTDEAIAFAEQNNPAYSEADASILTASQAEEKARKEKGLQVGVDVSVGIHNNEARIGDAINPKQQFAMGSVSLVIPLVDHGMRRLKHDAAVRRLEQVQLDRQETERSIRRDVINAVCEVEQQQRLIGATRRAMILANESFEQNQYNYAQGLSDINTFTIAQSRKDEAHNNYISALSGFWTAYYRLCRITMHDFIKN